jgi:chemotaxis protein CheD
MHAGQLIVTAEPLQITTILGSCVAVCVWDPETRVGGMNHFMRPYDAGPKAASPRYAKYATATLLVDVAAAGANLARLQAKIFGGACILDAFRGAGRDLGAQNIAAAREMLAGGGVSGRKLVFHTDTGATIVTTTTSR